LSINGVTVKSYYCDFYQWLLCRHKPNTNSQNSRRYYTTGLLKLSFFEGRVRQEIKMNGLVEGLGSLWPSFNLVLLLTVSVQSSPRK